MLAASRLRQGALNRRARYLSPPLRETQQREARMRRAAVLAGQAVPVFRCRNLAAKPVQFRQGVRRCRLCRAVRASAS